jgi:TATA-box binding protein (TBP) (component of TFIID and TFIIIB)
MENTCGGVDRGKKIDNVTPRRRTADFVRRMEQGGSADMAMKSHGSRYIWPENAVAQLRLAPDIDLREVSASRYNAYVPHRFETFTVRWCDGGSGIDGKNASNLSTITVLLFRTGMVVIAGSRAPEFTYQGAHRMRLELLAMGKEATFENLQIVNQVYSTTLETRSGINLGELHKRNMDRTVWQPGTFPGLKFNGMGVKARIFDTKNLVVMGCRNSEMIQDVFSMANEIAAQYPDDNLPSPEKRFDYRNEQKRLACSAIGTTDNNNAARPQKSILSPSDVS